MIYVVVMIACSSSSAFVLVTFRMKNDSHYESDSIMHGAISIPLYNVVTAWQEANIALAVGKWCYVKIDSSFNFSSSVHIVC